MPIQSWYAPQFVDDYFAEVNSRKQKSFLQLHSEKQELFQKGEFFALKKYF